MDDFTLYILREIADVRTAHDVEVFLSFTNKLNSQKVRITERDKKVVEEYFIHKKKYREIAELHNLDAKTVASIISRFKDKVKNII